MRYTPIEEIKDGDILAMTIFKDDCTVLLSANSPLTEKRIEVITNLGFKGLYIYDDTNDNSRIDLLSDNVRQEALRNLKHINIDDCLYIANVITNEIMEKPDMVYEMMTICSYDTCTYIHCINVAILATMMGVDLGMTNEQLRKLSQAALLHDIGKTCIDECILNKPDDLTYQERDMIRMHTVYGYNMLRNNSTISKDVCESIKYHHENEDGTGYPEGLKSDKIPEFAKIIHVADVYDAMISKRSYKNKINPADVLEYIMGNADIFNIKMITALTHCVALYPVGSRVELSDGKTGTVVKNTRNYPQRPEIRLDDGSLLNMMKTLNVTVTSLIS